MFGTRSARYGQLLLFAALLFGIFTMHTVGHPAEHGGQGAGQPSSHAAHSMVMAGAASAGADTRAVNAHAHHPDRPAPMRGMDPMAVCLAVLSVWGLALLTALLMARRPAGGLSRHTAARSQRSPRPPPPPRPRRALLTDLSVLRI
ncbi:DUF6153 family protein [Streptomyces sp. ITFR-6]|uniref:DUF6153 family protein n=1 Tax=Streptomyces sp. ITFR-6 TaxID=3075197 RepID=UPI0028896A82|nr:DUF6153 family protein [Streptomyces sp. ITFR-6]WNI32267.1 DUF6153 family protein [Streptomyces sp. ITFR-6]